MRATSSSTARTASVTSSSRVRSRTEARTWVESVRCVVRSRTSPASLRRASARSRRRSGRSPSARRLRKSASTLWWKPGSSSSRAMAYLKSMRQRTASAARRSDRPSRNCSTQTVASWAGEMPGRPSRGHQPAKSSSHHSPSRRSLAHIAVVPSGLLARAICAVRDGTCSPERGRSDNGHLDNCIGLRNSPSMPADHAGAPESSKIPDRVKLIRQRGRLRHERCSTHTRKWPQRPAPSERQHPRTCLPCRRCPTRIRATGTETL